MNPDGPYLSVAALCDAVLSEKNERISCVRFLDTVIAVLSETVGETLPLMPIRLSGLIAFKAGKFRGTKSLKLLLHKPTGEVVQTEKDTYPAVFSGDDNSSTNIILDFTLVTSEKGMYWLDVYLDDEIVTKIPVYVRIQIQPKNPDSVTVEGNSLTNQSADQQLPNEPQP